MQKRKGRSISAPQRSASKPETNKTKIKAPGPNQSDSYVEQLLDTLVATIKMSTTIPNQNRRDMIDQVMITKKSYIRLNRSSIQQQKGIDAFWMTWSLFENQFDRTMQILHLSNPGKISKQINNLETYFRNASSDQKTQRFIKDFRGMASQLISDQDKTKYLLQLKEFQNKLPSINIPGNRAVLLSITSHISDLIRTVQAEEEISKLTDDVHDQITSLVSEFEVSIPHVRPKTGIIIKKKKTEPPHIDPHSKQIQNKKTSKPKQEIESNNISNRRQPTLPDLRRKRDDLKQKLSEIKFYRGRGGDLEEIRQIQQTLNAVDIERVKNEKYRRNLNSQTKQLLAELPSDLKCDLQENFEIRNKYTKTARELMDLRLSSSFLSAASKRATELSRFAPCSAPAIHSSVVKKLESLKSELETVREKCDQSLSEKEAMEWFNKAKLSFQDAEKELEKQQKVELINGLHNLNFQTDSTLLKMRAQVADQVDSLRDELERAVKEFTSANQEAQKAISIKHSKIRNEIQRVCANEARDEIAIMKKEIAQLNSGRKDLENWINSIGENSLELGSQIEAADSLLRGESIESIREKVEILRSLDKTVRAELKVFGKKCGISARKEKELMNAIRDATRQ